MASTAMVGPRRAAMLRAMAKFKGTVRHNDLEGGFFELHTSDGDVFRLQGAQKLSAGDSVVVHGKVADGGFGLQMTGPAIDVERVEPA